MIWQNLPFTVVMAGGSEYSTLIINGSLIFHPNVINIYNGTVDYISSEMGNTIEMNGNQFHNNIIFSGSGEWILQDTLLVFDTTNWFDRLNNWEILNPDGNSLIKVESGTFNTNGQVVIAEGFSSWTSNQRNLILNNSHIIILGNWYLSGENMNFESVQSLITIRGDMNNYNSEYLVYNDIEVLEPEGRLSNTNIRTKMNHVHFLGNGVVEGRDTPGMQGSFTIDSLIFDGFDQTYFPESCEIKRGIDSINYVSFNLVAGEIEIDDSWFNHIEYYSFVSGYLVGIGNVINSINFYNGPGVLSGANEVNELYFGTEGVIKW